jgi:hypothetical protein
MAGIKNHIMSLSCGCPAGLTCLRELVFTEMHCERALHRM